MSVTFVRRLWFINIALNTGNHVQLYLGDDETSARAKWAALRAAKEAKTAVELSDARGTPYSDPHARVHLVDGAAVVAASFWSEDE